MGEDLLYGKIVSKALKSKNKIADYRILCYYGLDSYNIVWNSKICNKNVIKYSLNLLIFFKQALSEREASYIF